MDKKRIIIGVTGARSEYDLMYSIFRQLHEHPAVDFRLIVTGPHLSEKYGLTASFIENDGFNISERIYSLIDSDEKIGRITSIGNQIPLLAQSLDRQKPDIVLVAGDREEAISVTLTCAYLGIASAHFFGGDIAKDGNIDNSVRYAAGKFASIHFPTLEEHKNNLIKLGEDPWRIFIVGNPAIDRLIAIPAIPPDEVFSSLGTGNPGDYCVLIQHSIITETKLQATHIRTSLDAILESGLFCFINYPNSDAGSGEIIKAYDEYVKLHPHRFYLFKNLARNTYVNLLRHAKFLIGNSSSGLLEAPTLSLPAINIGSRQRGRIHGDNMLFVDNDKEQVLKAISTALYDNNFIQKVKKGINPYGDGHTAEKVVKVLTEIPIDNRLIYKDITY